jgi:hydrogenase-4 component B
MLAHSSIENMGLVTVGLGAAFTFLTMHFPVLAAMALVAALFHLVNHSLYKSLLFLGAGAVDQQAGSRHMDRLGGLVRRMPWTSGFFLAGVLSIAAFPPFNGFSSEWLLIQSLLRSVELAPVGVKTAFAFAGVLVALTAGLAATAFVRAYAMSFLGLGRSQQAEEAREAPSALRWGMGILAALCLLLGITPTYVVSGLSRIVASFGPRGAQGALVPPFFGAGLPAAFANTFRSIGSQVGKGVLPAPGLVLMHRIGPDGTGVAFAASPSYLVLMLLILLAAAYGLRLALGTRGATVLRRPWDGGRYRLWPEATYTATGFAAPVRVLFSSIFRRTVEHEEVRENAFRVRIQRQPQETYIVDRIVSGPLWWVTRRIAGALASLHHGRLNLYITYAFIVLLAALVLAHVW